MKPLLRLSLSLALAAGAALAHADPMTDDKRAALREFAEAYGIAALWPQMTPKVARDSVPRLKEAALAEIAADTGPDPDAQARAAARLDGLLPAARRELESALKTLDADELASFTAFEIYARYFETTEIREMSAFFGSPLGRKMAALSPEILAETRRRGGKDVLPAYFTEEERRQIAAFWASPVGVKMDRTSPDVREDLHRHFVERSEPVLRQLARQLAATAETEPAAAAPAADASAPAH